MTRTFLVSDPLGFNHRVHFDEKWAFGAENLGHEVPPEERADLRRRVLQTLYTGRVLPAGYNAKGVL